jgi:dTDP-4-amino-4,6-dideoxygalactose transaminase
VNPKPAIPIFDPRPQVEAHGPAFAEAFQRVLASGQYILGPETRAFEAEAASFLGVRHAVGVNSGTDALVIALRALGIGPGDEIITTPFTFIATAEAISHTGATPVFVDIDPETFNLDPDLAEAAITRRTRAILPVHLYGRPCDLDRLAGIAARNGLRLVEDCAQCFGAAWRGRRAGSWGSFGCFSFFPTKNLNTFGDGGLLATSDDGLAEAARMLRMHGARRKYFNEATGFNSRLDELHAALLRVKLPRLDAWNRWRAAAARRYRDLLESLPGIILPLEVPGHVFHQYTIRIPGGVRDAVQASLAESGIGTMVYYPVPLHRLPVYQDRADGAACPEAERAAGEVLSLPIWPEIDGAAQAAVAAALRRTLARVNVPAAPPGSAPASPRSG